MPHALITTFVMEPMDSVKFNLVPKTVNADHYFATP
jgi:hypothetical protein